MPPKSVSRATAKNTNWKRVMLIEDDDDDDHPIRPTPKKPAMPESDVAIVKSSSSHAASDKYWFWPSHCRSYTQVELDEMRRIAVAEQLSIDQTNCTPCCVEKDKCGSFPAKCVHWRQDMMIGNPKWATKYFITIESLATPFRPDGLILDKSRTAGDSVCSLTTEDYDDPHILNATGRSYSREAIDSAILASIKTNKPLVLEDCTIHIYQFHLVKLWPNYSLDGWYNTRGLLSYRVTHRTEFPLDLKRCEANDIPEASVWFETMGMDDIEKAYKLRRGDAADVTPNDIGMIFRDLVIRNAVITRQHPERSTTFTNVWFLDCVINIRPPYHMEFFVCQFERCIIVTNPRDTLGRSFMPNLKIVKCAFIAQTDDYDVAQKCASFSGLYKMCRTATIIPSNIITPADMSRMSKYDIVHRLAVAAGFERPLASDGELACKVLTPLHGWGRTEPGNLDKPFP